MNLLEELIMRLWCSIHIMSKHPQCRGKAKILSTNATGDLNPSEIACKLCW